MTTDSAPTDLALYVDDDPHAEGDADRISEAGLPCRWLAPPETVDELGKAVTAAAPSIVLLDYRLDDQSDANYRAGTVAAWLREQMPSIPVVLTTTQENLKAWVANNPQVRQLFDFEIFKSGVARAGKDEPAIALQLLGLASGYREIVAALAQDKPEQAIIQLFQPSSEMELRVLVDSQPDGELSQPPAIASWILKSVLNYPGPLLDSRESAIRLGLLHESFLLEGVRDFVNDCAYVGVFSGVQPRWWRGRLEAKLRGLLDPDAAFDTSTSCQVLSKASGLELEHGTCSWCHDPYPSRICSTCQKPVDLSHSLVIESLGRPGWAEPALACFICIADGTAEDERFIAGGEDLVASLKTGEIKQPNENGN